ncbi:uncharacterized protein [Coffea arabica]|uniref:Uncharacterized protein n=1 Tax=Coffea arabica TaxID=13443 RepID=A0ABM4U0W7_COFAR
MYYPTFENLKLTREQLIPVRTPLVGFGEHVVHFEEMVTLMVTVEHHPRCRAVAINFVVVRADSSYNLLMGRSTLNALRAVYLTYHLSFKFFTPVGIAEISSDICALRECYLATLQAASSSSPEPKAEGKRSNILSIDCIDPYQSVKPPRLETGDEVEDVVLASNNPDQTVHVDTNLPEPFNGGLIELLREYQDACVWIAEQVVGVPHQLMLHELNVDPRARPIRRKRRHFGSKCGKAVTEEVDKLMPTRMIKEIPHLTFQSDNGKKGHRWLENMPRLHQSK